MNNTQSPAVSLSTAKPCDGRPAHTLASDELRAEIARLETVAIPIAIESNADLELVSNHAKACKDLIKRIAEARLSYTRKLDEEKRSIMTQEKELTANLQATIDHITAAANAYNLERKRLLDEARQKAAKAAAIAQAELEERKAQLEASNAAFGIAPSEGLQEAIAEANEAVATAANAFTPAELAAAAKVKGTAVKTTWEPEVFNPDALPRNFLIPDIKAIKAEVQRLKRLSIPLEDAQKRIPGVRIVEKVSTSFR